MVANKTRKLHAGDLHPHPVLQKMKRWNLPEKGGDGGALPLHRSPQTTKQGGDGQDIARKIVKGHHITKKDTQSPNIVDLVRQH